MISLGTYNQSNCEAWSEKALKVADKTSHHVSTVKKELYKDTKLSIDLQMN